MLALLGLVALGALMVVPPLAGYERYVIEGGSMGSALPLGSIAYEEVVPVALIRVGDVITYRPPGIAARLVTHRVVWIGPGRRFRTRGDASGAADPWRFTLSRPTQAVVRFHVPLVGWAFAALGIRWIRMLVIGLPALLIAAGTFYSAFRGDAAADNTAAAETGSA